MLKWTGEKVSIATASELISKLRSDMKHNKISAQPLISTRDALMSLWTLSISKVKH